MSDLTLDEAMDELESAEDFLDYFAVPYEPATVHVNRLHILQRFHNYIVEAGPTDEASRHATYKHLLARAYQDFVVSDALTEKVFKVFHMHEPQTVFVPLTAIGRAEPAAPDHGECGCGGKGACHSSQAALAG